MVTARRLIHRADTVDVEPAHHPVWPLCGGDLSVPRTQVTWDQELVTCRACRAKLAAVTIAKLTPTPCPHAWAIENDAGLFVCESCGEPVRWNVLSGVTRRRR